MNGTAQDFLARCFAPGDTIALLLRNESTATTQQRIVALEQALAPRYLAWLARENHHGANIYAGANPLRAGSRKRTKESIASVRHLYLDIDEDGDARLAALRASDRVSTAAADRQAASREFLNEAQQTAIREVLTSTDRVHGLPCSSKSTGPLPSSI
jgi:RepB DNA-primase from phage plasmid